MSKTFLEVASCAPSQKADSYIYAIAPITSNGLAAITSADELLLVDLQNLQNANPLYFADVPVGLTSMVIGDQERTSIICAGRDGATATFDVRSQKRTSHFTQDRPITALACSGNDIATGSELLNHQAVVSVWDIRANKLRWQNTQNNDDTTDLHFHPLGPTHLLSGGVDGLVSIFDTTIVDEEDSLVQVINHGPIHKAGLLDEKVVYALSSDERLSLYPVSSSDESDDPEPVVFGDLRERLGCEYAIDVSPEGLAGYLAVGNHGSQVKYFLTNALLTVSRDPRIELRSLKDGKLASKPEMAIPGAHGDEIVRSVFADATIGAIFTGGEDGNIKAFRVSAGTPDVSSKSNPKKHSKPEESRFKPY